MHMATSLTQGRIREPQFQMAPTTLEEELEGHAGESLSEQLKPSQQYNNN